MAENKIPQNNPDFTAEMQQDDAAVYKKFAEALDTFERGTDENLRKMEELGKNFPQVLREKNGEALPEPLEQKRGFKMT